jgi:hypothetical protein
MPAPLIPTRLRRYSAGQGRRIVRVFHNPTETTLDATRKTARAERISEFAFMTPEVTLTRSLREIPAAALS